MNSLKLCEIIRESATAETASSEYASSSSISRLYTWASDGAHRLMSSCSSLRSAFQSTRLARLSIGRLSPESTSSISAEGHVCLTRLDPAQGRLVNANRVRKFALGHIQSHTPCLDLLAELLPTLRRPVNAT